MKNLEHIGIAVRDLNEANEIYAKLLGVEHYKIETVETEGVRTSFFRVGDAKVELLEATNPDSPIAKYIDKRGPGMHHIAFEVKDIREAIDEATRNGFQVINTEPRKGADNKLVCFLHPKSTGGVLIEFCQEIRDETA